MTRITADSRHANSEAIRDVSQNDFRVPSFATRSVSSSHWEKRRDLERSAGAKHAVYCIARNGDGGFVCCWRASCPGAVRPMPRRSSSATSYYEYITRRGHLLERRQRRGKRFNLHGRERPYSRPSPRPPRTISSWATRRRSSLARRYGSAGRSMPAGRHAGRSVRKPGSFSPSAISAASNPITARAMSI